MTETAIPATEQIETTATPEIREKPYAFRTLNSTDMFLMFRIINKIGIKEFSAVTKHEGIKGLIARLMGERLKAAKEASKENGEEASISVTYVEVIFEVADVVFRCLPRCESELYQLLANTSNLSEKQVKALPMADFTMMVIDFVKKEEFADFIKVVSASFK